MKAWITLDADDFVALTCQPLKPLFGRYHVRSAASDVFLYLSAAEANRIGDAFHELAADLASIDHASQDGAA